jgi:hypothetical protein
MVVAPHAIGAPQPAEYGGVAPEAVAPRFIVAATITALLFWSALGTTTGLVYNRLQECGMMRMSSAPLHGALDRRFAPAHATGLLSAAAVRAPRLCCCRPAASKFAGSSQVS